MVAPTDKTDETPPKLARLIRNAGGVYLLLAPVIGGVVWVIASPLVGVLAGSLFGALCLYMIFGFKPVNDRLRRRWPGRSH